MIALEKELRQLMLASLDGDASAYRELLATLSRHLRAYFAKRSGDDAEDLVQDTLIAIHTKRATYDPGQPFTAWVYAVARHKMIDTWRKKKRHIHVPLDDAETLFADDKSEAMIAKRDVSKLLNTLPAAKRQLIESVKIQGASVAEVSAKTGMSESAVKVNVHRGLKALAQRVKGRNAS